VTIPSDVYHILPEDDTRHLSVPVRVTVTAVSEPIAESLEVTLNCEPLMWDTTGSGGARGGLRGSLIVSGNFVTHTSGPVKIDVSLQPYQRVSASMELYLETGSATMWVPLAQPDQHTDYVVEVGNDAVGWGSASVAVYDFPNITGFVLLLDAISFAVTVLFVKRVART